MITPDLIQYIQAERAKNTPDDTLKTTLMASGWNEKDITEALATLAKVPATTAIADIAKNKSVLKKYQSKKRAIVFGGAIALQMLFVIPYFFGQNIQIFSLFGTLWGFVLYLVLPVLATYISAYLVTKGAQPYNSMAKEVPDTIIRIFGTVAVSLFVAFALFFVGCWVIIFAGGMTGI